MEKIYVLYAKTASLDVDAQNGFTPVCPNELPVLDGDKIVDECNKNAKKAAFRYMSKDAHPSSGVWIATPEFPQYSKVNDYKNVDIRWNEHCTVGTKGFELISGLPHPSKYDFIIYKGVERDMHPYSPVYHDLDKKVSTGLIEKATYDGIENFIIGGLALDFCVKEAALDLKEAGFNVIINLAATKSINDNIEPIVEFMKSKGIEFVNNSSEIIDLPF